VTDFVEEAVAEAIGVSPRKWALLIVAVVAGAMAATWYGRRRRRSRDEVRATLSEVSDGS
jgi:hypothetical protein